MAGGYALQMLRGRLAFAFQTDLVIFGTLWKLGPAALAIWHVHQRGPLSPGGSRGFHGGAYPGPTDVPGEPPIYHTRKSSENSVLGGVQRGFHPLWRGSRGVP